MATLLDLMSDALSELGQLGAGRQMSPEQSDQGLRVANRMIGKWKIQRLMLYYVGIRDYTLAAGTQLYTVGPTATLGDETRPTFIESAQVTLPSSDESKDLSILDKPKWDAVADKGAQTSANGLPQSVYIEFGYPRITLRFWPIPSNACGLSLGCWEPLQEFTSIYDDFAFPPGYENPFVHNLAVEWAPYFDMPVSEIMQQLAADGLNQIKGINAQSMGGALAGDQTLQGPNTGQPRG